MVNDPARRGEANNEHRGGPGGPDSNVGNPGAGLGAKMLTSPR